MSDSRIEAPVRVLVADCGAPLKQAAAEALTRRGFTVEVAAAAEESFEKVRVFRPNLVFYDLELPGYDGFEAVTLISKMRSAKEGFIVASSFHRGGDYAERSLASGAWDYMAKPLDAEDLLETALAVRRHINRPKEQAREAESSRLTVVNMNCGRLGCKKSVAAFHLKGEAKDVPTDQFETPLYSRARDDEMPDYGLLAIAVCPRCYFSADVTVKEKTGRAASEAQAAAVMPRLLRIAAEADNTLFSEDRTPAAAVVAYRLAVESAKTSLDRGSAGDLDRVSTLLLKAAAAAHLAGDERLQDKFFAEAENCVTAACGLEPCAEVYRSAYRLVALYVLFMRDVDAASCLKRFDRFSQPSSGRMRPRDQGVLGKYRSAAERLFADKDGHRRANYLAD